MQAHVHHVGHDLVGYLEQHDAAVVAGEAQQFSGDKSTLPNPTLPYPTIMRSMDSPCMPQLVEHNLRAHKGLWILAHVFSRVFLDLRLI